MILTLKNGISITKEKVTKFLMGALENQEENYVQPKNDIFALTVVTFLLKKKL